VVLLAVAIVAVAIVLLTRRRRARVVKDDWARRRASVLDEASGVHDRATALVGRWSFLSAEEIAQICNAEEPHLERTRDRVRTVALSAPSAADAAPVQGVADALDDLRVALADGVRTKASPPPDGYGANGLPVSDACAALLDSIRQARGVVRT
jgi:hypothetical protein